jgi:undecaprenyl-diphosphatase
MMIVTMMTALLLGILQGLTEFLPVSSSGHLVLAQRLLGWSTPGIAIDVLLHLATLLAVVAAFWPDVVRLVIGFLQLLHIPAGRRDPGAVRMFVWVLVGSIPAALLGIFLGDLFESLFSRPAAVGIFLLLTGLELWFAGRMRGWRKADRLSLTDALVMGLGQGVAIAPGLSRSGTTLSAGLLMGIDRETAFRYSFLLSIPAIGGAALLKVKDLVTLTQNVGTGVLAAAFVSAFVFGLAAIVILRRLVIAGKLRYFAYYCAFVGVMAIAFIR